MAYVMVMGSRRNNFGDPDTANGYRRTPEGVCMG